MIDFSLTEDQQMLVETVKTFAAKELAPKIPELDKACKYDPETFKKFAQAGITGICFPEKYGGAGMDYISLGLACEELEYVDTSLRTILSVHTGLCGCGIYQWGSEEQKQKYLTPIAKGERFGAFGLTEPGAGSDAAALSSRAKKNGSDYIISGQKIWISCADQADTFLVFAYTDTTKKHNGISAFIIDRKDAGKGFSTFPIHDKAGVRAGNVGGISMDEVRVPKANLLGEEGEGFKIAMSCLDNGRFTVAAGATGLIRASLDASLKYAHERKAFGKSIGEFQLVQEMIAKMVSDYDAARLLYFRAGWLKNQGIRATRESALAKWHATVSANHAANDAVEIHGAYGFSDEYPVARFLRNSKGAVIYEGSQEIQKLIQAEYALGLRKDKPVRCPLPGFNDGVMEEMMAGCCREEAMSTGHSGGCGCSH